MNTCKLRRSNEYQQSMFKSGNRCNAYAVIFKFGAKWSKLHERVSLMVLYMLVVVVRLKFYPLGMHASKCLIYMCGICCTFVRSGL